jgi:hypothetical protein
VPRYSFGDFVADADARRLTRGGAPLSIPDRTVSLSGPRFGFAALSEGVIEKLQERLGGLERGVALPSLTWLVGLRSAGGAEFGLGPNVTPAGVALAVAGGVTFRSGALNVPVTFAVVPSKAGMRVSMLTGFNLRGRR